ncbi:MAG TPA: hypothetical protein VMH06_07540 [Thermodesulfovibrionales bacterium]|nr:hypothetical protein [Thermodesulfovibrionales bacterium]
MNKVAVLTGKDSEMMNEFSNRCLARVETRRTMKLLLAPFHRFLKANVAKEIDKDRLIIECAVSAFQKGTDLQSIDRDVLFEKTKHLDAAFIKKVPVPLIAIDVRYQDFAEIRKKRIDLIFGTVYDLSRNWKEKITFPALVRETYTPERFGETITEILHLYNLETRELGGSIKLPPPLGRATAHFVAALYTIMEEVAAQISREYTEKIFGPAVLSCQSRT